MVSVSVLYLFAFFFHGAPHVKYLYLRSTVVLFDSVSSLLYIYIYMYHQYSPYMWVAFHMQPLMILDRQ